MPDEMILVKKRYLIAVNDFINQHEAIICLIDDTANLETIDAFNYFDDLLKD